MCNNSNTTPNFGGLYHVKGVISLPYAEIEEPFEAWYNLTGNKSRIEYYNGQVVTLQLGCSEPYGALFKITPATTENVVNIQKCFLLNGTKESQVKPQGVFPDMKNFKSISDGSKNYCTFSAPQFFQQTMGNTNIPALVSFDRPEKAVPIEKQPMDRSHTASSACPLP
ncbi:hypothetical protein L345_02953 [Ophiophagus hannah]|uniref:Uncharacterized protein n=1 Tax=Ophiophagus hannah TaxID=8665 RepID=V8PB65_OPHHA|nr:hypothetical protein L345_02953 [Ophiophagus hannah]